MTHQVSDEQLKHQLRESFPADAPLRHLAARIDNLVTLSAREAHQRAKQQESLRPIAWASWAVLMIILIFPFAITVIPSKTGTGFLEDMNGAMDHVHSLHIIDYAIQPNGSSVKRSEAWFQDGKYKDMQFTGSGSVTHLTTDGKSWTYDSSANTLKIERHDVTDNTDTSWMGGWASFSKSLIEGRSFGIKPAIVDLGTKMVRGRRAHQFSVASISIHAVFSVDPVTDLPFHLEMTSKKSPVQAPRHFASDMDYSPMRNSVFKPDFPKNAHVIDNVEASGTNANGIYRLGRSSPKIGSARPTMRGV